MYLPLRIPGLILCQVRWRTIDAVEAARLAEQAREVLPHRTFAKPPEPKPVKPPKPKPWQSSDRARCGGCAVIAANAMVR